MPICIECCYPVPQLYHVLSSKKKTASPGAGALDPHSRKSSAQANASSSSHGHHLHQAGSAAGAGSHAVSGAGSGGNSGGFKGGGEAKKKKTSGGADVRLMQCPRCKRFADKYVEHDFVVLFIDLVLVKPQVYRHLLFNRLTGPTSDSNGSGDGGDRFDPSIQRLGVLLVLFDVYLTWSAIETSLSSEMVAASPIPRMSILGQYLFYLALCSLTVISQHVVIRELSQLKWFRGAGMIIATAPNKGTTGTFASSINGTASASAAGSTQVSPKKNRQHPQSPIGVSPPSFPSRPPSAASGSFPANGYSGSANANGTATSAHAIAISPPPPPRKNAVSTAIFVSSCMKLFPILMVVWKYEDGTGQLARGVSWAVAIQNVEALRILLGCGYSAAAILVGLGWLASSLVSQVILSLAGLGTMNLKNA